MKKGWLVYWTIVIGVLTIASLAFVPFVALEGVGKLFAALSPFLTVGLAIFGLYVWRLQLIAKRRFEVAEECLVASYRALNAISSVRSPFGFSGEGKTRERRPEETPEEQQRLDRAYVPIERLERYTDQFASLEKAHVLAEVFLSNDAANAVRELLVARNRIAIAAGQMMPHREDGDRSAEARKRYRRAEAIVWEGIGPNDAEDPVDRDVLSEDLKKAKLAIEAGCKAWLRSPTFTEAIRIREGQSQAGSDPAQ